MNIQFKRDAASISMGFNDGINCMHGDECLVRTFVTFIFQAFGHLYHPCKHDGTIIEIHKDKPINKTVFQVLGTYIQLFQLIIQEASI